jgi:hypothetical protein
MPFGLGHICVPSGKCKKMIWEAHYCGVIGNFNMENIVTSLQKYFYYP